MCSVEAYEDRCDGLGVFRDVDSSLFIKIVDGYIMFDHVYKTFQGSTVFVPLYTCIYKVLIRT